MSTRPWTTPLIPGEAAAGASKPALAPKGGGQANLSKEARLQTASPGRQVSEPQPTPSFVDEGPHPVLAHRLPQ